MQNCAILQLTIPLNNTSATSYNSTNLSTSTATTTYAFRDSTRACHYAAFSSTNMATYSPFSSTTATTTTCTTSSSHFSFSIHITFTRAHATFFSINSNATTYTYSCYPTIPSASTTTNGSTMGPPQGVWQPFSGCRTLSLYGITFASHCCAHSSTITCLYSALCTRRKPHSSYNRANFLSRTPSA